MNSALRRVTIPVPHDRLERSIHFYQQVLGMQVNHNAVDETDSLSHLMGIGIPSSIRQVVMQAPGSDVGMVGLMDYLKPEMEISSFEKTDTQPYPLYLIFAAVNVPELHAGAVAFGAEIIKGVKHGEMPGRGKTRSFVCLDPNGVFVEFLELDVEDCAPRVIAMRRAMIAVPKGNVERTMAYYERALGMRPLYDVEMSATAENSSLGFGAHRVRTVSLQQGESTDGMVGVIEYLQPALDVKPLTKRSDSPYRVTFVFQVDDIGNVRKESLACGSREICRPLSSDGPGGATTRMTHLDPNGVLVDFASFQPAAKS